MKIDTLCQEKISWWVKISFGLVVSKTGLIEPGYTVYSQERN